MRIKILKIVFIFSIISRVAESLECGHNGSCKLLENCLPAINDIKLNGDAPKAYCNEDEGIVCCEEPHFVRKSQRRKSNFELIT